MFDLIFFEINGGGGEAATIELSGENFTPGLSVWFGETESPCTDYR
jgi:hypothetical protein